MKRLLFLPIEVNNLQPVVPSQVALNDVLGVAVALHGSDYGSYDLQVVQLMVEVEIANPLEFAFLHQQGTFFIYIPAAVYHQHILVLVAVFPDGFLHPAHCTGYNLPLQYRRRCTSLWNS